MKAHTRLTRQDLVGKFTGDNSPGSNMIFLDWFEGEGEILVKVETRHLVLGLDLHSTIFNTQTVVVVNNQLSSRSAKSCFITEIVGRRIEKLVQSLKRWRHHQNLKNEASNPFHSIKY